jgi:hypothetical protein
MMVLSILDAVAAVWLARQMHRFSGWDRALSGVGIYLILVTIRMAILPADQRGRPGLPRRHPLGIPHRVIGHPARRLGDPWPALRGAHSPRRASTTPGSSHSTSVPDSAVVDLRARTSEPSASKPRYKAVRRTAPANQSAMCTAGLATGYLWASTSGGARWPRGSRRRPACLG